MSGASLSFACHVFLNIPESSTSDYCESNLLFQRHLTSFAVRSLSNCAIKYGIDALTHPVFCSMTFII